MKTRAGADFPVVPDRIVAPIGEVKQLVADEENVVEFFASVFGNEDEGGDVMMPGAFAKTIRERVPRGLVKLVDAHMWSGATTYGTVIEAEETDFGLRVKAKLDSTQATQDIKTKMLEGHLDRFSIGYDPVVETFERRGEKVVRLLKEVKLYEVSVVPVPMNELASLIDVKSVVGFRDLPMAPAGRDFDPEGARVRVRQWAGDSEGKSLSLTRYRRAFLYCDRKDPTALESHRLPIADVVDGRLMAVPRAICKAALSLHELPEGARDAARAQLEPYMDKLLRGIAAGEESAGPAETKATHGEHEDGNPNASAKYRAKRLEWRLRELAL